MCSCVHGTLGTNEKLFPRCPEAKVLLFLASGQIFHQFVCARGFSKPFDQGITYMYSRKPVSSQYVVM